VFFISNPLWASATRFLGTVPFDSANIFEQNFPWEPDSVPCEQGIGAFVELEVPLLSMDSTLIQFNTAHLV
jgi:hypothetical protein